jgi:hypothetical protein
MEHKLSASTTGACSCSTRSLRGAQVLPTIVVSAHQRFKHAGLSAALAANHGNLWKADSEVQGDLHVTNMIP